MRQTKKATGGGSRKGPTESATKFSIGVKKRGNDGNMWTIISTAAGVHRWAKASQTRRNRNTTTTHKSKRIMEMEADPTTVWGKNKPLEKFWQELASGKKVVLITKKDGDSRSISSSRIVTMPTSPAADKKQYIEFDEDPNIIAILSSNLSQDAYEVHLYPKAKDNTVEYVIKNYKKFFKPLGVIPNMNKVLVPA
jgi:capsule polysaccharide export protein KpsC/LpsZ